jgi:translocation and assembly module TamB
MKLATLAQEVTQGYNVSDVELALDAKRDHDGMWHVDAMRFANGGAGTELTMSGALEWDEVRRRLSMKGQLKQDLAKLWTVQNDFSGKGDVTLDMRIESSDLRVLKTMASVHIADATVRVPKSQLEVDDINGEVPIVADIVLGGKRGFGLLRNTSGNRYSELRFADQHPLLSRRSFISIGRIESPLVSIAPFAGNLQIEQNVVSVSQLELGVRQGRVTGQCTAVLDPEDPKNTTATARIRATGVMSSHGEPFDGNAAVVVHVRQRSLDGRLEVLRIGPQHLNDLLDMQDPHHTDTTINRIRQGLGLGYPEHVHVTFDHGFYGAIISLGGLAKLATQRLEMKNQSLGPIIDKAFAGKENE